MKISSCRNSTKTTSAGGAVVASWLFCLLLIVVVAVSPTITDAFSATPTTSSSPATTTTTSSIINKGESKSPIFEYLKFNGQQPTFDVLEKTKEHVLSDPSKRSEDIYHPDYVLRGAVIGPLTRADLTSTQDGFDLQTAFDIDIDSFGFTIDPENPYRCFYFQRWRAIHNGPLKVGGSTIEATNNEMEAPVSTFSTVWTPDGQIIYEQVGAVVDRFEGNTQGKAAVFGLLHTAGIKLPGGPGSRRFRFLQRLGHWLNNGRSFSEEDDIPSWWKSTSRGADPTDQY